MQEKLFKERINKILNKTSKTISQILVFGQSPPPQNAAVVQSDNFLTEEQSERLRILKFWLSIMVVFIHSNIGEEPVFRFTTGDIRVVVPAWLETFKYFIGSAISGCAVPAFFFMSALFLYRKQFSWKENMKKKFHTLVIPYFLLNTFWIVFHFCFLKQIPLLKPFFGDPNGVNGILSWNYVKWLDAYLGIIEVGHPFVVPLWFMRDLYFMNILSIVFLKTIDIFPKTSLCVLLFIWLVIPSTGINILDIQSICFWGLGCFFVRNNIDLGIVDRFKSSHVFVVYAICIIANVLSFKQSASAYLPIHRANILIGIIFWYRCATRFKIGNFKKFLLWLSSFNYSIYVFHDMPLGYLKKLSARVLPTTSISQFTQYICLPIVVIICCILLSMFLKKYFPRSYSVITGNRKV